MKVLFTCAGGKFVKNLIRYLKVDKNLSHYDFYGTDQKKISKGPFKKIFKLNIKKNYINNIKKICILNNINLIIPYSDSEALILSKYKKLFGKKKIMILTNNFNTNKRISNKFYVYNLLKKKKIKVPKFYFIKKLSEFNNKLKLLNFPNKTVVLKPIDQIGGRGVVFLKGKDFQKIKRIKVGKREKVLEINKLNFTQYLKKYKKILIMEKLNPPAHDVDYFRQNKKKLISIRRRINPSGIPYKGNTIIQDKKIEKYCNKIVKTLNINSLIDIDLLQNEKKDNVLLEINPRPSGSIVINHKANFPFLSFVISSMFKKNYKIKKLKSTRKILV